MAATLKAADPTMEGSTVVVTGASSGIGRAIAIAFAESGADVVIHARVRRGELESLAERIRAVGRDAFPVLADIAEPSDRERLVAESWNWRGRVDTWINNAGADVLTGPIVGASFAEKLDRLWRTDVVRTIELTRLAGRRMRERPASAYAASIVNMGWDQAEWGMEGDSGEMFAAAKGAVMAFTRSAARSMAPRVRVNCVAPGWIRTAWGENAPEHWQRRAVRESLLQRWGTPEDVAAAARFLASGAAAFVTGQVIAVNGGLSTGSAPPSDDPRKEPRDV